MLLVSAGTKYTGVNLRFGTSAGVSTAFTPGSASAARVSMRTMRACGYGLRSILPWSMPGIWKFTGKPLPPVTLSRASGRATLLPITLMNPSSSGDSLLISGPAAGYAIIAHGNQ